jgi:hypothetical protein
MRSNTSTSASVIVEVAAPRCVGYLCGNGGRHGTRRSNEAVSGDIFKEGTPSSRRPCATGFLLSSTAMLGMKVGQTAGLMPTRAVVREP